MTTLTRRALLGAFAALLVVRPKPAEPNFAPETETRRFTVFEPRKPPMFEIVCSDQLWTRRDLPQRVEVLPGDVVRYSDGEGHPEHSVNARYAGTVVGIWVPETEGGMPFLEYLEDYQDDGELRT